ncbi:hypothetical protein A1O3_04418 [Capronia epimyces CBS 606.96]|uniref:TauD/TfdA-like domain-containing protein n=1 Tax=Capronia epimyces CBS 606.96 TaxID=1182542 RepID=W9Y4N2_9EURO|nr:uncharacterized protein A1O3_04418 [Capronia epimyces CBS 606.96]EXJ87458.1 hypothetical protein A1O3_04418 [Capronia epimyces CBS 606.96]
MSFTHTGITEQVLTYKAPDPQPAHFEPPKDRAFFADPEKKALLSAAKEIRHLTPYIGTELVGVQLSQLTDAQKDELALLVSERGVVFFRDQDLELEQQHTLTKHYGIQDRDPNQQDPRHVTILGHNHDIRQYGDNGGEFHSDHSHELNPPAYTMLRMVRTPPTGGDTIFTSQTALYDKLSPTYKHLFDGLTAVHSSEAQYINSLNRGYQPFRAPHRVTHPLVRTHPVTKVKSLFYNPSFVIHFPELKGQESVHLLHFLRDHLHSADDLTVRWKWTPGSVAFWDNRVVAHRAVPGGYDPSLREGKRTAIFGEKPFLDPEGLSLSEAIDAPNGDIANAQIHQSVKLHFSNLKLA